MKPNYWLHRLPWNATRLTCIDMSTRKQPYIALYTQDFITDERLMECSAMATGVYIRLMCLLHQSEQYGRLTLRPKDHLEEDDRAEILKQISRKTDTKTRKKIAEIERKTLEFAQKIQRNMPYSLQEIALGLHELLTENVVQIDGDTLLQKRMVRDNELSEKRSKSGIRGMQSRYQSQKESEEAEEVCYNKTDNKPLTESATNANIYNIYNEIENENEIVKGKGAGRGKAPYFTPPNLEQVEAYCQERGGIVDAQAFIDHYTSNGWMVGRAKMKDWKAAVRNWERKENQHYSTNNHVNNPTHTSDRQLEELQHRIDTIYKPLVEEYASGGSH